MDIETLSLYKDGNAYCACFGHWPECTNPEIEKGWGATKSEALLALSMREMWEGENGRCFTKGFNRYKSRGISYV